MIQKIWKQILKGCAVVAEFQGRLVMNLFYFLLAPVGLYLRFSADPMRIRPGAFKGWREHPAPEGTAAESAARQS